MDGVCKVNGGRAAWQPQYFPLGCEHVHFIGEQIDFDALEELLRAAALLNLHQARQPLARAIMFDAAEGIAAGFVFPVRGNA